MTKNRVKERTILDSLDTLVEEHHLLKHPFYQAWTEGTLSKESLQLYAEQYYQHVRAFPENLQKLALRTDGNLAKLVNENLAEELDPSAPHPQLWRQFAESLGVSDADLDRARPLPGIAALLDAFDEVASEGKLAEAVAAFYVYEAQVPEIATQKISGLSASTTSTIRVLSPISEFMKRLTYAIALLGASGWRARKTRIRSACFARPNAF